VLIEATSKKSKDFYSGRNPQNTTVVFPKEAYKIGEYVNVLAHSCTPATLIGKVV
jgi:tRNA-2-methylthio-N6-dimethylallyladenosine synthase